MTHQTGKTLRLKMYFYDKKFIYLDNLLVMKGYELNL